MENANNIKQLNLSAIDRKQGKHYKNTQMTKDSTLSNSKKIKVTHKNRKL